MTPRVLLLTDFQGLIPQRIHHFEGLNLEKLESSLRESGFDVIRIPLDHPQIFDLSVAEGPTAAIFATSQFPEYAQYLRAILSNIERLGVRLFPAFEHVLAHEDKVYQALRLSHTAIAAPRCYAFGYLGHVRDFLRSSQYPLVVKTARGFGSQGVRLVRNEREGIKAAKKLLRERVVRPGRSATRRAFERLVPTRGLGRVVFQEFIPGCKGDWKILIWEDAACGLFRRNRPGDFRASGSGSFEFRSVPDEILEFAYEAAQALALPFASLDVLVQEDRPGDGLFIVEYQGVHFGLTTADKGHFHYIRRPEGKWIRREGRVDVELAMVAALVKHFP